ncbi:MAG: TrkA family potassium uptake protein [Acidobacteriota bacterium]|nr:TrkA family potassium uptake protein [Acidobacteriota bacterium]MDE3043863.1 TrkA family potassium uptake protein [Acidobacteriota bacterium]
MDIIVVGCGRVGSELAMQLSEEGHSVVVIDKNREAFRRLTRFHGKTLIGSGFDRDVLFQADASHADALAAVTSGDNTNILCARIARDNYAIKNVVARIYDPQRADIYMKLGIPTVATSLWTTQQVKRWMLPSDESVEWTDGTGTLHLVERILPDRLAGRPISDFNLGVNVRVVGIVRAGQGRVNIEGLFAQEDDVLEFLVTATGATELATFLEGTP